MKFSKIPALGLIGAGAVMLAACGSAPPPPELLDARAAYNRAQSGAAPAYKPDALHQAQMALVRAEQSYEASADERDVRSLAYLAERKAELADVEARDAQNAKEQAQAQVEIQQLTAQQLSTTTQQLQVSEQRRAEAERRARDAFDRLVSSIRGSSVMEETRGLVFTLPGEVLFASGKSTLLPSARQKLNQVAEVLRNEPDRHIAVEGHTDSKGSEAKNQVLSQLRAEAVKNYLVERGVSEDRITATGAGSAHAIASNETAEGRANNRRVEIIVESTSSRGRAGSEGNK